MPNDGTREDPEPTETIPGPLRSLAERLARPESLPVDDSPKSTIREALAQSHDKVAGHSLTEARLRYDDVLEHAESIERRAGTLSASVIFAVTLTLTGGALLLDTTKVPNDDWRTVLAAATLVAVVCFALAGYHASLAVDRTEWKVVGKASLYPRGRQFNTLADAQRYRAAAYIWCINRNMPINRWKADELGRALNRFLFGVVALILLAGLIGAYAVTRQSRQAEPQQPARCLKGDPGPRGLQGERGPRGPQGRDDG